MPASTNQPKILSYTKGQVGNPLHPESTRITSQPRLFASSIRLNMYSVCQARGHHGSFAPWMKAKNSGGCQLMEFEEAAC